MQGGATHSPPQTLPSSTDSASWKDRQLKSFCPLEASILQKDDIRTQKMIDDMASALRSVKSVVEIVEMAIISTKESSLLGSTSRAVQQGDQPAAIRSCRFVAIRGVKPDKAQELRDKVTLDAPMRICKVVGECYVKGMMDAELLRDGCWTVH